MNTHAMKLARPTVRIDAPEELSDAHAGRIVEAMLQVLAADESESWHAALAAHRQHNSRLPANPTAQRRFFERLRASVRRSWLAGTIVTGKRKFSFTLDSMAATAAGSYPGDGDRLRWLVAMRIYVNHDLDKRQHDTDVVELMALSHHALVRLVQRARCATPQALGEVLRDGWGLCVTALLASDCGALLPGEGELGWILPVPVKGGGMVGLVLRQGPRPGPPGMIATVLDEAKLDMTALTPLLRLMAANTTGGDTEAWLRAFRRSADAARRTAAIPNHRRPVSLRQAKAG